MPNIIQLFVYRDASCISDVIEVGPTKKGARQLKIALGWFGFNEWTQAQRDADGNASWAEVCVKPINDYGAPADGPTETRRVLPAALPPGCRRPRACVEVDGVIVDLCEFASMRLSCER